MLLYSVVFNDCVVKNGLEHLKPPEDKIVHHTQRKGCIVTQLVSVFFLTSK